MGSLKLEQRQKVESNQERSQEIQEVGEQKIEEAETSAQALESIETPDDDDKAAVDEARRESDGIAKQLAESEIKEPSSEVGKSLEETKQEVGMVIESIDNIQVANKLAKKYNVEMPIVNVVYDVLYNNLDPKKAVNILMTRDPKFESEN